MSGNKITALIIVALIHIFVGYALITGLAYTAMKKVVEKVTTVDIKEPEKPKEEPPPPPPKKEVSPPPPVAPPVKINVAVTPPQIETVTTPPPAAPIIPIAAPAAPVIAPPPPPKGPTNPAQPKGNPGTWATTNDYPSRALREERQGTTGFKVTVDTNGRVSDCVITSSSGSDDLDATTCQMVTRRARFKPAMQNGEPVTGTYSNRIRWVIPQ